MRDLVVRRLIRRDRGHVHACAALCGIALGCLVAPSAPSVVDARIQSEWVSAALTQYSRGEYDAALIALGRVSLAQQFKLFEKEATRWVERAPDAERSVLLAATMALEVAHLLRDAPTDQGGAFLTWASRLVREHPAAIMVEPERLWHRACLAGMQELDSPWILVAGASSGFPTLESLRSDLGDGGQLAQTLRRFPEEPRAEFAKVAFLESQLQLFWPAPSYGLFARDLAGQRMPAAQRSREDRLSPLPYSQAREFVDALARVSELIRVYERLASRFEELSGEVSLHVGVLERVAGHRSRALQELRRVPFLSEDPYLRYLGLYTMGLVFQDATDHLAAASAFEAAWQIIPARSAAIQWSLSLTRAGSIDQVRAYDRLLGAFSDTRSDPIRLYGRADARMWDVYMKQLRQDLR